MDEPTVPFDLHRMFIGDDGALFYLEILVRTGIIYAYTLVLIRWIGGRSVAQLSMIDMLLVIALGSAVGDSMFYPEVPLLQAMAVVTVVVGINKGLDKLIERSNRAKTIIDGSAIALVRDGRILSEGRAARDLSTVEVKGMLRINGIANLGQVDAAFLEAGGGMSVFRRDKPVPGLALVPPDDVIPPAPVDRADQVEDGRVCCMDCGALRLAAAVVPDQPCRECGGRRWTAPRLVEDSRIADPD